MASPVSWRSPAGGKKPWRGRSQNSGPGLYGQWSGRRTEPRNFRRRPLPLTRHLAREEEPSPAIGWTGQWQLGHNGFPYWTPRMGQVCPGAPSPLVTLPENVSEGLGAYAALLYFGCRWHMWQHTAWRQCWGQTNNSGAVPFDRSSFVPSVRHLWSHGPWLVPMVSGSGPLPAAEFSHSLWTRCSTELHSAPLTGRDVTSNALRCHSAFSAPPHWARGRFQAKGVWVECCGPPFGPCAGSLAPTGRCSCWTLPPG